MIILKGKKKKTVEKFYNENNDIIIENSRNHYNYFKFSSFDDNVGGRQGTHRLLSRQNTSPAVFTAKDLGAPFKGSSNSQFN